MEPSSFTIEFPEHLAVPRQEYCLFHLRDLGAAVEPLGKSCKTPRSVWYMSACNGILTGHEAKQP